MIDHNRLPVAKSSGWKQSGFVVAAILLAASAIGLNAAVAHLQLAFLKQPVPLVAPLDTVPARLGHWLQVSKDEPLDHAVQEALGTQSYVFREYANADAIPPAALAGLDRMTSGERRQLAGQLQAEYPEAVVNVAVTYYTGMVDTVAHVPERCYVADGWNAASTEQTRFELGPDFRGNDGKHGIDARLINFEDGTSSARTTKRVAYFFLANGRYEYDPISVREHLEDLRAPRAFYSKVELAAAIGDPDRAKRVMADFLTWAMPAVQKCYPEWDAVGRAGGK